MLGDEPVNVVYLFGGVLVFCVVKFFVSGESISLCSRLWMSALHV
jgi:hypothetical protein